MPLPFEFTIAGPPVSQQARRRDRVRDWIQRIRGVAALDWDGEPPVTGPVMVSITYFFSNIDFDVDNIPKPILDALKGLVYLDDKQVTDLICRKRSQSDGLDTPENPRAIDELLLSNGQILFVQVSDAPVSEVFL